MEEQPTQPTLEQHGADLEAWLKARNLTIVVIAVGKRTGATMPIADFMPDTHNASFALAQVQP